MRESTNTTCICKRKTNIVSHSVGEIRTKASRLFYTSVEKIIKRKNFFIFFLLIVWSIYRRFAVRRGANVYERREYNINFISSFLHFLREIFFFFIFSCIHWCWCCCCYYYCRRRVVTPPVVGYEVEKYFLLLRFLSKQNRVKAKIATITIITITSSTSFFFLHTYNMSFFSL